MLFVNFIPENIFGAMISYFIENDEQLKNALFRNTRTLILSLDTFEIINNINLFAWDHFPFSWIDFIYVFFFFND